jgi:hypothetical protein
MAIEQIDADWQEETAPDRPPHAHRAPPVPVYKLNVQDFAWRSSPFSSPSDATKKRSGDF